MKKKLALFGSFKLGTADYIAHLYPHLLPLFDVESYSFSHMANDDKIIPSNNELLFQTIKDPHLILRPTNYQTLAESYIKLKDALINNKPDVFNLHVTALMRILHYFFRSLIVDLKKNNIKVILTIHDVMHIGEQHLVNNDVLSNFYQLGDSAIVGSPTEKDLLVHTLGFRQKVLVAEHGVYNLFNQNFITRLEARKKLGFNSDDFIVLFFGYLRENKGLDLLIKAVSKLKRNQKIKLYIASTVRNHYEQIEYYNNLVASLNLGDKVIINIVKNKSFSLQEVETFFKAADCLALPYTTISQSGVMNLAAGFNMPVILSDAFTDSKEIKNKLGLVVPTNDIQSLANAIEEMSTNYEAIKINFNKNISDYNKSHSWEKIAKSLYELSV